jgi:hypothetical protein
MKKYLLILLSQVVFSQVAQSNIFFAREFDKETILYKEKSYVINDLLGASDNVVKFEIDQLTTTNSGDLTSLFYNCEELNKEGLILGFYGDYYNDAGLKYQGYGFKNVPKEKAIELLNKIEETKLNFKKFLSENPDINNVYFKYDDLTLLIYYRSTEMTIRVLWKTFDSIWQDAAFKFTKRRFEKKVK